MKRLFYLIACLLLIGAVLCGCSDDIKETPSDKTPSGETSDGETPGDETQLPEYEPGSYVLLVYMCGSSLETKNGAATKNLAEILSADIPEGARIVVQTGGARAWRALGIPADKSCRYELSDGALLQVEQNPDANMGLAATLSDFIVWGAENYPAETYSLILWDHGGGSLDGVCYDENYNNDSLTLKELDAALATADVSFEFIGFDACLMATYETAYIVRQYASNMIASQELEPAGGWDYNELVENLGKDDFYERVLQGYARKAASKNYYTLSHIDFSRFSIVEGMFNSLFSAIKEETSPRNIINALRMTVNFGMTASGDSDLFDLGGLCSAFGITGEISDCILTVNGTLRSTASGVSLYFPLNSYINLSAYGGVSPLQEYVSYLESFFAARDSETISFLSYAENVNNYLSFRLTNDSLENVQDVSYALYQFEQDGNRERVFSLGVDSEVNILSPQITVNFKGNWALLDGKPLCCDLLGEDSRTILFSTPVTVDLAFAKLIFSYDKTDKSTEILGVIYEGEEGRVYELKEGQIICVTRREVTGGVVSEWDYDDEIVYGKDTSISVSKLKDGLYQYTAYVTDVYGKTFAAGTAVISIEDGQTTILYVTSDEIDYGK